LEILQKFLSNSILLLLAARDHHLNGRPLLLLVGVVSRAGLHQSREAVTARRHRMIALLRVLHPDWSPSFVSFTAAAAHAFGNFVNDRNALREGELSVEQKAQFLKYELLKHLVLCFEEQGLVIFSAWRATAP
jgi:hypothetical protein